jgi:diaminohydroxyphosphoribosylaminopyrimidine deaminase/5-amino-6-(5-phosphoribosylamino)uracil reductase
VEAETSASSSEASDASWMDRALDLAARGRGHTAPNPMVGAVVVRDDRIVGEGFHERAGAPHAEVIALSEAGDAARGGTLYVTLEPCTHHGRTPPCTDAIIAAGIRRVVAAIEDPNPESGNGATTLRAAGIAVDMGPKRDEAFELNAAWIMSFGSDRPWVTLKLAVSLDGAIADKSRTRGRFTGDLALAEVHRMRASSDAVAVGVATAIADDPMLTARTDPPPARQPVRIVFDRSARLPPSSRLARTAREVATLLVTDSRARLSSELVQAGVQAVPAKDIADTLRSLRKRGIASLLVEGGAGLAASFLAAGCVDRLVLFHTPLIFGAGALGAFSGVAAHDLEHAPRFRHLRTTTMGDDVMTIYSTRSS